MSSCAYHWCFTANVLYTRHAKWVERPPNIMKRSQRRNIFPICPLRDSNLGGTDLFSKALPIGPRRRPALIILRNHSTGNMTTTVIIYTICITLHFCRINRLQKLAPGWSNTEQRSLCIYIRST